MNTEALLDHVESLRALAKSLLLDEHQVDDVLQETRLVALRRGRLGPRAWLASVVRNFALKEHRTARRRLRRETRAARSEAVPAAADVAARVETQRRVADAVLALQEPYRTAILLRYFEDLTPQEIAAREGVPAATVRSHVRRGLAKLRGSLDERYGSRRASSIALLALAGTPRTSVAAGLLVAAGAAVVLIAALVYLAGADRSRTDAGVERTAARAEKPGDAPSSGKTAVEPVPEPGRPTFPITGRVVTPWGEGIAGASVYVVRKPKDMSYPRVSDLEGEPGRPLASARSEEDGSFRLATTATGMLAAKADGFGWAAETFEHRRKGFVLTLFPVSLVRGTVVDEEGHPVAGARVRFFHDLCELPGTEQRTAADGSFALEVGDPNAFLPRQSAGIGTYVVVQHEGFAPARQYVTGAMGTVRVELSRPRVLEGTVRTPEGEAAARADVRIQGDSFVRETTTDEAGTFRVDIGRLRSGWDNVAMFRLHVDAGEGGHKHVRLPWTAGHRLELVLDPVETFRCRLVLEDAGGRRAPAAGVRLRVFWNGDSSRGRDVVSDAQGRAVAGAVGRKGVGIVVLDDELALARGFNGWFPDDRPDEPEVVLWRKSTFRGRVVADDGTPIENAPVWAMEKPRGRVPFHRRRHATVFTDADGGFVLRTAFGRKEWVLAAWDDARGGAATEPIAVGPGSEHEIEIRLPPVREGVVEGQVIDPSGNPVALAQVTTEDGAAYTARDGRFRIEDLGAADARTLYVWRKGFVQTKRSVEDGAGVRIVLEPSLTFRGRLVDGEGEPIAGVRVSWSIPTDQAHQGDNSAVTDEDGRFEFRDHVPGRYWLGPARPARFSIEKEAAAYELPFDGVKTFVAKRLPPRLAIEGRVLDGDGRPFPAMSTAWHGPSVPQVSAGAGGRASCDLLGRFVLDGLAPGEYTLRVQYPHAAFANVKVKAGARGVVFQPIEPGSISGVVLAPDGAPLHRARVYARDEAEVDGRPRPDRRGTGWPGARASTDAEGRFEVEHLVAERFVLVAFHPEYGVAFVPGVRRDREDLEIRLPEGRRLAGRVEGAAQARVEVRDVLGVVREVVTDAEGRFEVTGLADGECRVRARAPERLWAEAVGVRAGDTDVRLRLEQLSEADWRRKHSRR